MTRRKSEIERLIKFTLLISILSEINGKIFKVKPHSFTSLCCVHNYAVFGLLAKVARIEGSGC
jgi:hypothetical protein